jgi:hypothetical protein
MNNRRCAECPRIEIVNLYTKAYDDQKSHADNAWETIKFNITLSSTLITVTLSLLGAINYLAINAVVKAFLTGALILFPIIMKEIVDVGEKNFKRECKRMCEATAILMKIEEEFPQRKGLSENNHFYKDDKYTPRKWDSIKYPTTEKYIEAMMQTRDTFYSSMRPIFPIFRCLSYLLLSIIGIIVIMTIAPVLCSYWYQIILEPIFPSLK